MSIKIRATQSVHLSTWQIISDGSVGTSGDAACAAMVHGGDCWRKLNAFLGPLSSSEAELFGGLLGLSYVWISSQQERDTLSVCWKCDSKTTIESAKQYQEATLPKLNGSSALWSAYSSYAAELRIECIHLGAEQGDKKQRACDKASRWARERGRQLLRERGEGKIGRLAKLRPEQAWYLIDARSIVASLQNDAVSFNPGWLAQHLAQC